jgi:hypothetical protein
MALFTDGPVATLDDLKAFETSILEVANTEGVDLPVKLSVAHEELGVELAAFLTQRSAGAGIDLERVVVTAPLKQWGVFHALAVTYRDAHHSHLNDRYLPKWKEYGRLAKLAAERLFQIGVGIVNAPVPRPGLPEVTSVAGPLAGGTYYVRVTCLGAGSAESSPSEAVAYDAPALSRLNVKAAGSPAMATGWNVYVGLALDELKKQNDSAIGVGQTWTMADSGLRSGAVPPQGQRPDFTISGARLLSRG